MYGRKRRFWWQQKCSSILSLWIQNLRWIFRFEYNSNSDDQYATRIAQSLIASFTVPSLSPKGRIKNCKIIVVAIDAKIKWRMNMNRRKLFDLSKCVKKPHKSKYSNNSLIHFGYMVQFTHAPLDWTHLHRICWMYTLFQLKQMSCCIDNLLWITWR